MITLYNLIYSKRQKKTNIAVILIYQKSTYILVFPFFPVAVVIKSVKLLYKILSASDERYLVNPGHIKFIQERMW